MKKNLKSAGKGLVNLAYIIFLQQATLPILWLLYQAEVITLNELTDDYFPVIIGIMVVLSFSCLVILYSVGGRLIDAATED